MGRIGRFGKHLRHNYGRPVPDPPRSCYRRTSGTLDMFRRIPDVSKIKRVTGWEPKVPLDTILDRVIEYFRADGARV